MNSALAKSIEAYLNATYTQEPEQIAEGLIDYLKNMGILQVHLVDAEDAEKDGTQYIFTDYDIAVPGEWTGEEWYFHNITCHVDNLETHVFRPIKAFRIPLIEPTVPEPPQPVALGTPMLALNGPCQDHVETFTGKYKLKLYGKEPYDVTVYEGAVFLTYAKENPLTGADIKAALLDGYKRRQQSGVTL